MPNQDRKYWFRAKRYGWGWGLPLTWQGWTVLLLWLSAYLIATHYLLPGRRVEHFLFTLVMILLLVGICYLKGEPAHWRWGGRED